MYIQLELVSIIVHYFSRPFTVSEAFEPLQCIFTEESQRPLCYNIKK